MAIALLIARLGPSKVASTPSPSDFTRRPRWRSTSSRTSASWRPSSARQAPSPSSRGALGRADDVGEEDRGEHAVADDRAPDAGQELLDLVRAARPPRPDLDVLRVGDVLGGVARVALVDERVVGAAQHQRRALHAGQRVAHVELADHRQRRGGGVGRHRQALVAREQAPRAARRRRRTRPTAARASRCPSARRPRRRSRRAPRRSAPTRSPAPGRRAGVGVISTSARTRSGCEAAKSDRQRAALGDRHQHRLLRARGVEHRPHVVDLLLERRRPGDAAGHPGPTPVELDQPRERRQPLEEARQAREIPAELDVRHERRARPRRRAAPRRPPGRRSARRRCARTG